MSQLEGKWPGDEIEYLEEVLKDYTQYVQSIGEHGLSAPLLLYYRDEVQETLTDLEGRAPLELYWVHVADMDNELQKRGADLIAEIGKENYKLQRETRKPPKEYWWWYLDKSPR